MKKSKNATAKPKPSSRVFFKTVIKYEVLSERPIGDMGFSEIIAECDDGEFSGVATICPPVKMTGLRAARALQAQGSDPEFFQLTSQGADIDA